MPLRRNRDYMLVWAGQGVSELGSQVSTVAYLLLLCGWALVSALGATLAPSMRAGK